MPVRIGAVKAPPLVPVVIAQQEGMFAREGLQAEIVLYPTLEAVRQALLTHAVDAAVLSVGATLQAFEEGIKLRNVVLLQGRPNATIVTRKTLKIRKGDLNALRGRRIGVDAHGGRVDVLLRLVLLQVGINPDLRVTIVPTGDIPGHLAAMQAGWVDAQVTWEPGTSQLTLPSELGLGEVFLDMRANDRPFPVSRMVEGSVVALDEWVQHHRDAAVRIARAVSCAERAIKKSPNLVASVYRQSFPGLGPEVYANIAKVQPAVYWPSIRRENILVMNEAYRKLGLLKGTVRFE
ncbi:MAG TPA: ABC transporter substrate-binding protein, partial [bacterium]|nr:ABC transporter substrate-binding protein [bacterium]